MARRAGPASVKRAPPALSSRIRADIRCSQKGCKQSQDAGHKQARHLRQPICDWFA